MIERFVQFTCDRCDTSETCKDEENTSWKPLPWRGHDFLLCPTCCEALDKFVGAAADGAPK